MNDYCDIKNNWNFTENGDLELTEDYTQSINNRITCPSDFLNIYYEEYGSDIPHWLGESFNKDMIKYSVEETLKQDEQIREYTIDSIDYTDNIVRIRLTINEIEMMITLNEESNEGVIR